MKTLIVEDDFTSRLILEEMLKNYGPCHLASDGKEAVDAARMALDEGEPYDLICLDIMMPEMDGQQALKEIRAMEEKRGINSSKGSKIIMITVLADYTNVRQAYHNLCDTYLTKPIDRNKLVNSLQTLGLIPIE